MDERGKSKVEIEGVEYTIHFTLKRIMQLEKKLGRPISDLLPQEPSLGDLLILIEIGIGENLPDMDRLPPNFLDIVHEVTTCLSFCLGTDTKIEEPKGKKGKKK